MSAYEDYADDFDPYLGLGPEFGMDSPQSEWCLTPNSDPLDEIIETKSEDDSDTSVIKQMTNSRGSSPSCRGATSRIGSRYPSPDDSSEEEVSSEYLPTPLIVTRNSASAKRHVRDDTPRSPSPLVDVEEYEYSSTRASSPSVASQGGRKTKSAKKVKSGGGRKGEPRREQNMLAQKKYRDKKVHTAYLMSKYIIRIRRALDNKGSKTPKRNLLQLMFIVDEYRTEIKVIDPNLSLKQDRDVDDLSIDGSFA